ncbi:MAG: hypothetical protein OXF28_04340 [Thaumarchaeota archaeon]|nr:hypothetical protein [Nitrososphaerota archaeon]
MSKFYQFWIRKNFLINMDINCDTLVVNKHSLFQRLDIPILIKDHLNRDKNVYHFYLCYFKPIWTDCTCNGYHAENFGMIWWQSNQNHEYDVKLAKKNCAVVSHELSHELLRQQQNKNYIDVVHQVWSKHIFDDLQFQHYDKNFYYTKKYSKFLTIDTSQFKLANI